MELFEVQYLYYIVRIIVAGLCGGLIGYERTVRSKGAGIRTHCVVACAAALMMIISKYAFTDVITQSVLLGADVRLDPSRVASTIVSGVGFLGAGTIFVHKNKVSGLTTAAGIWATSGVGMAIGSGLYVVGIAATVIIVFSQIFLHMNFKFLQSDRIMKLKVFRVTEENYQNKIKELLAKHKIHLVETKIYRETNNVKTYSFIIDIPADVEEEYLISLIEYDCEISNNI
ncbi:MAG: MgtC/SapB family protein [Agathobacter sp.]|nr:MgtC/SapB family protein [Agathobacter sp.]